jgi:hypothetical protein
MKSSKRKRVGRHVDIRAPSSEDWENIIRDLKLTSAQARTLKDVLDSAIADIRRYRQKLENEPDRAELVRRLKRFAKFLRYLRDECGRAVHLMQHFLPHDTLAYIGQSLTFSAMSEALGRDVFPRHLDLKIEHMRASDKRVTLAFLEQDTRATRQALGLKHGNLFLTQFIERLHGPLTRWIELDRQNKGGRPANAVRGYLIYRLAEATPDIIGELASISSTGTFVELCTAVLVACGLPEAGIAKAIPGVVSKLRRDQDS